MRKYHNTKEQPLKEYFLNDPRYEISPNISRFTGPLRRKDNPGILWDNIIDVTFDIQISVLYIDLD